MKKILIFICVAVIAIATGVAIYIAYGRSVDPNSIVTEDPSSTTAAETEPTPEGVAVRTERFTKDDTVNVEYLVVSGMEDEATQAKINELLQDFYLWQWRVGHEDEPDFNWYEGKASYALVGDLLSVTREMTVTDPVSSAWPQKEFSAQTFQLADGEIFTFPLTAAQLKEAIAQDIFRQDAQYPDIPLIEGAQDLLLASLDEEFIPPYFLLEDSLALYVNNAGSLENACVLFKANYADLPAFAIPGRN